MAEFLLKLVSALTPLGVKEMKRCGCGEQVEGLIDVLAKLTVSAMSAELTEPQYGETDKLNAVEQGKDLLGGTLFHPSPNCNLPEITLCHLE